MKRILAAMALVAICGFMPIISFAQNIGGACGDQWDILPSCGTGLECVGGRRFMDETGTCQPKNSGTAVAPLPTWYGPEDTVAEAPKSNFLSWLKIIFLPKKDTDISCANPNKLDCTLPDGKKGYCGGIIGENKKCMPWIYAQATQPASAAQPATPTAYAPAGMKPCAAATSNAHNTNSKNTAACAPRNYCAAGPLFDYEECAKPITARYQAKIDKIAADLKDASKLIQDDWSTILAEPRNKNLDLNASIQSCINKPSQGQTLDNCVESAVGPGNHAIIQHMSDYLKKYSAWILDTSARDRDRDILSQCGDPSNLTCDRYDFGCPSVCVTDPLTGIVDCSD